MTWYYHIIPTLQAWQCDGGNKFCPTPPSAAMDAIKNPDGEGSLAQSDCENLQGMWVWKAANDAEHWFRAEQPIGSCAGKGYSHYTYVSGTATTDKPASQQQLSYTVVGREARIVGGQVRGVVEGSLGSRYIAWSDGAKMWEKSTPWRPQDEAALGPML